MESNHPLHQAALQLAKDHKRVEANLVDIIIKIDHQKIFRKSGFASLFEYVNRGLGLSESVTYGLIAVARKSIQVPELKVAVLEGSLSLSQAKRITSVITKENAQSLIQQTKTMTQREIEKVVATLNPLEELRERTRRIGSN